MDGAGDQGPGQQAVDPEGSHGTERMGGTMSPSGPAALGYDRAANVIVAVRGMPLRV
jgi:hypothetical protein